MLMWLDHKIFGNGFGLASPYSDSRFYWLSGELYTWSGWFGAQLQSFKWRHPRAGERRILFGYEFRALHSTRYFWWLFRGYIFAIPLPICRVSVAWARVDLPKPIDEANAALRQMQVEIGTT